MHAKGSLASTDPDASVINLNRVVRVDTRTQVCRACQASKRAGTWSGNGGSRYLRLGANLNFVHPSHSGHYQYARIVTMHGDFFNGVHYSSQTDSRSFSQRIGSLVRYEPRPRGAVPRKLEAVPLVVMVCTLNLDKSLHRGHRAENDLNHTMPAWVLWCMALCTWSTDKPETSCKKTTSNGYALCCSMVGQSDLLAVAIPNL